MRGGYILESKFKFFVIIAIVVLSVSIAGSTFYVLKQMNQSPKEEVATTKTELELTEVSMGDAIMTNIAMEDDKIQHFAKVKISLGVDASNKKAYEAFNSAVTNRAASMRNELIAVIGEQTFTMLRANDGKTKLADEMVARLNQLLGTDIIYDVYYEEYFVQ